MEVKISATKGNPLAIRKAAIAAALKEYPVKKS